MTKYIRSNCKPWCGTLSKAHWTNYRDLPGYYDQVSTYWEPGFSPYVGNSVPIYDSGTCREMKVGPNIEESTMKETWYVWKVSGGTPMVSKSSEMIARQEAERLCNIHGGEFVVCKAIASCTKSAVIWKKLDEIVPF